jgi:hypothetical protein
MSETALFEIGLCRIVIPHIDLVDTEYVGRTPALVVASQLVEEIEGHVSHGFYHLSSHLIPKFFNPRNMFIFQSPEHVLTHVLLKCPTATIQLQRSI